jgi:hypothetical protein
LEPYCAILPVAQLTQPTEMSQRSVVLKAEQNAFDKAEKTRQKLASLGESDTEGPFF